MYFLLFLPFCTIKMQNALSLMPMLTLMLMPLVILQNK